MTAYTDAFDQVGDVPCSVRVMLDEMPDADVLDRHLARPAISSLRILRALHTAGHRVTLAELVAHRTAGCGCDRAPRRSLATAVQRVPALASGVTRQVTLTLDDPMVDDTYRVRLLLSPDLVGALQVAVTARTETTVTVAARALAAVTAGGTVTVLAYT